MERLSALDAEFLDLEDGAVHMHIAGACIFPDPPPALDDLEALIDSKLHLIPRYRQRVRTVPFGLGRPVWADDPQFVLRAHVRHTALPSPGDDPAFCRLMGALMSRPLDRERPLWEVWLVEGLEGGRWAMISKVHHCLVDGIAGVGLLTIVLDLERDTPVRQARPWDPTSEPPGACRVVDAWAGLVTDLARTTGAFAASLLHPAKGIRTAVATGTGAVRFLQHLAPTDRLSIEGPIGPDRAWAHSSADLAEVKTIGRVFGATVNDVALATVAGGYRALLVEHGDDPDDAVLRSLVPVSTRHEDGRGVPDNRVSALLCELPVHVADPVDRLEVVRDRMATLKATHMAEASEAVTTLMDLAPPMVLGFASRLAIHSMHRFGQQSLDTVTTNVPGPDVPLYCLGREMLDYRPFVPISHGPRVGTAILSYNGRLFFGVTGDATVPDVGVLATEAAVGIGELHDRARHRAGEAHVDPGPESEQPNAPGDHQAS
jgi:diacylglycerol O-acyltransferase / wax synthase